MTPLQGGSKLNERVENRVSIFLIISWKIMIVTLVGRRIIILRSIEHTFDYIKYLRE